MGLEMHAVKRGGGSQGLSKFGDAAGLKSGFTRTRETDDDI